MADDEEKKKILDSCFKGDDDHNQKKPPTTTTETPVVDIPAKVKQIAVKGDLWKLMNENDDNSTTIQPATAVKSDDQDNSASSSLLDDVPAKMKMPAPAAVKSSSTEIPMMFEMDDIPAKVKMSASTAVKSSSSEIPMLEMDDIPAKVKIPALKSDQLSSEILISDDTSPLKLNLSDEAKRDILRQMNNKVNANENRMLEMDDIPAKVKTAAEAPKSETPDRRFPLKTDYPRCYGIGPLSETVVLESRLRPTIGERSSDKADPNGDDDGSNSSDDESGNVSVSESDDVKHGGEGNCSSDN